LSFGAVVVSPFAARSANAATAVFPGKPTAATPTATVVPGSKPPILDFGDGFQIVCDKSAFLTLWEGKTFWLTFGAGRSAYALQAQGQAVNFANSAMKLLLMTLAFAPNRMEKANGGWRMKPDQPKNWVRGDIKLPGAPYWPITDASLGFGNMDDPAMSGAVPSDSSAAGKGAPSLDPAFAGDKVSAFCCYLVLKQDMSLDDVRARAQILLP
jgi:hypothetical protein